MKNERFYRAPEAELRTHDDAALPVSTILRSTLEGLVRKRGRLLIATALPLLVLQATTASNWIVPRALTTETIEDAYRLSAVMIALSLFAALVWGLLAVACHRVMLDDEQPPTLLGGISLGARQIRYLLRAAALGLPVTLFWAGFAAYGVALINLVPAPDDQGLLSMYLATAVLQAILLPAHYLVARFSLALPAAALLHPMSFGQAWSESRGNGWRLTLVLLAAPILASFIRPLLDLGETVLFWPFYILGILVNLVTAIFAIAALSYSYDWVMNHGLGDQAAVD